MQNLDHKKSYSTGSVNIIERVIFNVGSKKLVKRVTVTTKTAP